MHIKKTAYLLPPRVDLPERCDLHHQGLLGRIDAELRNGQESARLGHIPNVEGKHLNNDYGRQAETFFGDVPDSQTHPSQPLPYRPRLPTPLKPPASVLTPTTHHTSGAEAPQAPKQPASRSPCQKYKSTRECGNQVRTSFSGCKRQYEDAPENLANAHVTRREKPEQHVQVQPDNEAIGTQIARIASEQIEHTQQRPAFNTKPAVNRRPTGESAKRKRSEERQPSRCVAAAPNNNTNHGKGKPVDHSEDEGGSGSERQPPNRNSRKGSRSNKPAKGLPFRCPMFAADPNAEAGRNCKEWHNASIADVTRHALVDAGEGTAKWQRIKELSTKLAPKERWRRYFVIFNNGQEDPEMHRPYWGGANPDDTINWLIRCATATVETDAGSATTAVRLLLEYQTLMARREQRDSSARARADATRAVATQLEQAELLQSQRLFDEELATLFARMGDVSPVPPTDQPDITTTATLSAANQVLYLQGLALPETPMQRTTSGQSTMNAAFDTPFNEPAADPEELTLPSQSPFPSSGRNPGIGRPNASATAPSLLKHFIADVDTVVDSNTDPMTRQQVQSWQNSQYQQSQTLRPPQRDQHRPSHSASGSSRRNAIGLTSSNISTQQLTPISSSTTNSLQPPRYAAPMFGSDDNGGNYMDYDTTEAPSYYYGDEHPLYGHMPRTQ
ncbi:hypothetical protein A1O7_05790 [Cladophialophora yegresii CBS 114405]|uniref:Uncharacterized protein n=1 Tax=Cladophialophora yegresii CBS 114405 TaxID=1182544 RepID=W9W080_9EURO|nr:uncharacterized protein A1O7_05790 [Cladophialophora yegresii CBS 114405]EXJ58365.1 hypothetical protein A1O7_05790 [Cladophialophora yegresii CBS 114405]